MIESKKNVSLKSILFATLAISLTLSTSAAFADDQEPDFVLSIVTDMAYGDVVQRGEYERAIRRIRFVDSRYPYPANTNLCVAHIMLEQYDEAQPHCDKAVEMAAEAARTSRRKDLDYKSEWSASLTNRGALRALSGNLDGAREDFLEALALNADTALPEINLAQLQKPQAAKLAEN